MQHPGKPAQGTVQRKLSRSLAEVADPQLQRLLRAFRV